jgi:hypothetical protein
MLEFLIEYSLPSSPELLASAVKLRTWLQTDMIPPASAVEVEDTSTSAGLSATWTAGIVLLSLAALVGSVSAYSFLRRKQRAASQDESQSEGEWSESASEAERVSKRAGHRRKRRGTKHRSEELEGSASPSEGASEERVSKREGNNKKRSTLRGKKSWGDDSSESADEREGRRARDSRGESRLRVTSPNVRRVDKTITRRGGSESRDGMPFARRARRTVDNEARGRGSRDDHQGHSVRKEVKSNGSRRGNRRQESVSPSEGHRHGEIWSEGEETYRDSRKRVEEPFSESRDHSEERSSIRRKGGRRELRPKHRSRQRVLE